MGPLDALRRTEQQIQEVAHQGAEAAKATLHNVGSQVRRRMRLKTKSSSMTVISDADPESPDNQGTKARTGIVSVNGHDVEKMRCTGGRKTA